ncbi:MAG: TPR end-of-group domain-containing protein [Candidatus Omnitrophota bacterium]
MKSKKELEFEMAFFEGILKEKPLHVDALKRLAETYSKVGEYRKGLELDLRLVRLCGDDPLAHYNLACSYALIQEKEKAIRALQCACRLGYDDFGYMLMDQDLRGLHGDAKFRALIEQEARKKKPLQRE